MSQITCLQIFTYQGISNKFWAFKMMQFAHKHLRNIEGLKFYKLMGSGKGLGFNPLPDWSTYALLTVWEDEKYSETLFNSSQLFNQYQEKAFRIKCYYMKCIKSHGKWSGENPFDIYETNTSSHNPIAVITRATIKKRHLLKFWSYVPHSTTALKSNPDLIYTKGIGEIPIIQMATFSVWKNLSAINQFAYKNHSHKKAISLTRKHNWYKEEMFSRFEILKITEFFGGD